MGNGVSGDVAVERETFCGRMGNALCGVCVGFVLFFVSIFVLGYNEFNYVNNQSVILYVEKNAKEGPCTPSAAYMEKGVWASCPVTKLYDFSQDPVVQNIGLFSGQQLQTTTFSSSTSIYQWKETKTQTGEHTTAGGTKVKTYQYTYSQEWTSSPVDSSSFYCINGKRDGCVQYYGSYIQNTGSIPSFLNQYLSAPDFTVTMGTAYGMNSASLSDAFRQNLQPVQPKTGRQFIPGMGQYLYVTPDGSGAVTIQQNQGQYRIGDLRSNFNAAEVEVGNYVSVVARQSGGSNSNAANLKTWNTGLSGSMGIVNWAFSGSMNLEDMAAEKRAENDTMVYALRILGWLAMFIGMMLVTGPISLAPEIIPCVGGLLGEVVGCALCMLCFSLSVTLSLFIIAVAWLAARPLLGIGLLCVAAAAFAAAYYVKTRFSKPGARTLQQQQQSLQPSHQAGLLEAGQAYAPTAVAPVAPARPAPVTMQVQCPPGVAPGQPVEIQANGQTYRVTVPAGVAPGQNFQVNI